MKYTSLIDMKNSKYDNDDMIRMWMNGSELGNIDITFAKLLMNMKIIRSSIIPYTIVGNDMYLLMGIDSSTGDITDLGGGVKKHECAITGGIREFNEESRDIFKGQLCVNNTSDVFAITNKRICAIFVPVSKKWYENANKMFENKSVENANKKAYNEIQKLVWISESEFRKLVSTEDENEMWSSIKKFYNSGFNLISDILKKTYINVF